MNLLQMLKEDNDYIRKLLKEHESYEEDAVEKRRKAASELFLELEIHLRLTEEVLYPSSILEADEKEEKSILIALVRHRRMKEWITELKKLQPADIEYKVRFLLFQETLEYHLEEEEKELFPRAERAFHKEAKVMEKPTEDYPVNSPSSAE
jgi:hypothetical protein